MRVIFKEKVSKTNQGGLKKRRIEAKVMQHVEDTLGERSFTFMYFFDVGKWLVYYECKLAQC